MTENFRTWTLQLLPDCPLSTWEGDKTRCRWCNAELPKRRTVWCSDECSTAFSANHFWNVSSWAARRRDEQQCVICRRDPLVVYEEMLAQGTPRYFARRYLILQVHHMTPVLGKHGEPGCRHHLDGLETLCLFHHVERHHGANVEANQLVLGDAA